MTTSAHAVVQDMILADDKFHAAVQAVNARSHIHIQEFQPALEQLGLPEYGYPLEAVEKSIVPRLTEQLKRGTDEVYLHVHAAIEKLAEVGRVAPPLLRAAFPGSKIIGFKYPGIDTSRAE